MTSPPSSKPRPEPVVEHTAERPLRALLASIVDYAGLFPPAGLDMAAAVRAYDRYRRGEHAWMLGSFVVPSDRIAELAECMPDSMSGSAWPLSVLVPSLGAAPASSDRRFEVTALEVAPQELGAIVAGRDAAARVRVFYEVRLNDEMEARLDAVARAGGAAKVRTGGVTAEAFPPAPRLAAFVHACAERGLAFKATAGLHHPKRGCYPLTYEPGSTVAYMYGFLDLALVAALLRSRRIDEVEAAELLTRHSEPMAPEPDGLRWHGHVISSVEIAALRDDLFLSFGSCSFEEPVADLERIGLL